MEILPANYCTFEKQEVNYMSLPTELNRTTNYKIGNTRYEVSSFFDDDGEDFIEIMTRLLRDDIRKNLINVFDKVATK